MIDEIRNIWEYDAAGDPMTGRKWTRQTPAKIARCLEKRLGIRVSAATIRRLLDDLDYSLKANNKALSAGLHPDRDKQFAIIKRLRENFSATADPIISVDTKKKELIGLLKIMVACGAVKPPRLKIMISDPRRWP